VVKARHSWKVSTAMLVKRYPPEYRLAVASERGLAFEPEPLAPWRPTALGSGAFEEARRLVVIVRRLRTRGRCPSPLPS
jgi:hypothetical protein